MIKSSNLFVLTVSSSVLSSEGKILEDPSEIAPEYVFQRTCSPEEAPEKDNNNNISEKTDMSEN